MGIRVRPVNAYYTPLLEPIFPEEDEMQCPNRNSARTEPYAHDPDDPVEDPFEDHEQL